MIKLLGISLALVMLIGSVSLGFSEPLRVQLEQGIETDQLQCNNLDHVLVQRTNGKLACVTEKTAEKTGWIHESLVDKIDTMIDDKSPTQIQTLESEEIVISTNRITIDNSHSSGGDTYATAPTYSNQPWTTVTYPEEIILGEPFDIEYTWTFVKTYSEANGDEYPSDDLDKNPWAQEWSPDAEWEDENDLLVWQEIIEVGKPFVMISADKGTRLLSDGFMSVAEAESQGLRYPPQSYPIDDDYPLYEVIKIHPYDREEHTETLTFQIDEPVNPSDQHFFIRIDVDGVAVIPMIIFDGNIGHITNERILYDSDIAILQNKSSLSEINVAALVDHVNNPGESASIKSLDIASNELPNPYPCIREDDKRWNWEKMSLEDKLWELRYPSMNCDEISYISQDGINYQRVHVNVGASTSTGGPAVSQPVDEYLLENFTTRQEMIDYLINEFDATQEIIDQIFDEFPSLNIQSILPSTFSFLPSAFGAPDNFLIFANGIFLIEDEHGNPISPIGVDICLYDKQT